MIELGITNPIDLRKGFGVNKPSVSATALALKCGFELHYYDHPDFNFPFSIKRGNECIIVIPIMIEQCYENYYVAQQMGHFILNHFDSWDMDTFSKDNMSPQRRVELIKEASEFANDLLLPIEWVWKEKNLRKNISDMACLFNVPEEIVSARVVSLEKKLATY